MYLYLYMYMELTGWVRLWKQVSGSGAQDNRRNVAVNVHVMKRLLLCVFSHAAACQTCPGVG